MIKQTIGLVILGIGLAACSSDADIASRNLSQAGECLSLSRNIQARCNHSEH